MYGIPSQFSRVTSKMPKNCCAFGCSNVYRKGCGLQFYRFPVDSDRRTGVKSNHPFAPNYISTLFKHTSSPVKRSLEGRAVDFDRRQSTKKRRAETTKMEQLAVEAAETWSRSWKKRRNDLKKRRND